MYVIRTKSDTAIRSPRIWKNATTCSQNLPGKHFKVSRCKTLGSILTGWPFHLGIRVTHYTTYTHTASPGSSEHLKSFIGYHGGLLFSSGSLTKGTHCTSLCQHYDHSPRLITLLFDLHRELRYQTLMMRLSMHAYRVCVLSYMHSKQKARLERPLKSHSRDFPFK